MSVFKPIETMPDDEVVVVRIPCKTGNKYASAVKKDIRWQDEDGCCGIPNESFVVPAYIHPEEDLYGSSTAFPVFERPPTEWAPMAVLRGLLDVL